ncbi:MAG: Holliday junction branch migration DNA helicase RuvB [Planctomycetota bacterium]
MPRERVVSAQARSDEAAAGKADKPLHATLRPERFDHYVGQRDLLRKLRITVQAADQRGEPVDHTLFHGPPGLGKTTLAHVIANEIGTKAHVTAGPALTKPADLVGVVTSLGTGDVLFIDEIHRLSRVVEEYLYVAMEDYKIDITLDSGSHARVVTMPVKPFTLVGATTRIGLLTAPMRARFGLVEHLDFYPPADLLVILQANAQKLGVKAEATALEELSHRSRGTPRVANRLLRRVRDFASVEGDGDITADLCRRALELEGIDAIGLDALDRSFLRALIDVYSGGPAGIEAVAATLGEERDTLEDVIEPYLLQQGLLARTRQGRRVTKKAYDHLGLPMPESADSGLFA